MINPPFTRIRFLSTVFCQIRGLILLALLSGPVFAQGVSLATLNGGPLNSGKANAVPANPDADAMLTSPMATSSLPEAPEQHRFWDRENRTLFATVAVLSAADFAITRSILQNGGKELNPVTRLFSGSTAGLAVNFAGETAGVIGVSYFFHKTGHHKLERYVSMVNIGSSAAAVSFDLAHR